MHVHVRCSYALVYCVRLSFGMIRVEKPAFHLPPPGVWDDYTVALARVQQAYCHQTKESIWAPAKTSDIFEQLHQDIDTWYYHEALRNDKGDTKNDDFWYTRYMFAWLYCKHQILRNDEGHTKKMAISATSFRGHDRFSPLLLCKIFQFEVFYLLMGASSCWLISATCSEFWHMPSRQPLTPLRNLMVMTNQRDIDITQFVSGCMRMKGASASC